MEPRLLRAVQRYTGHSTAQDLVQDVAVLALQNVARFATFDDFRRWAYTKLHWLVIDAAQARPQLLGQVSEKAIPPSQEQSVFLKHVLRLIAELPPQQQAVMRGLLEGDSYEEIAAQLRIAPATVRSLQRFARHKLITLLGEEEVKQDDSHENRQRGI